MAEGRTFGALSIYAAEADAFDGEEVKLLAELAGDIAYGLMALRSLEARRRAEGGLRRLRVAVEQSVDGIVVTDLDGVIQFANPAWARMHGCGVEELIGSPLRAVHTSGQVEYDLAPRIVEAKHSGASQGEVGHARRDGSTFPTWMSIALIKDEEGRPTGLVATARDITERKRAEEAWLAKEAAERANQQKSEFLSRMSHELRTPLNSILGFAQLLEMRRLGQDEAQPVQHILKGGQHLLSLINDVLDIARVEAGRVSLSIEAVSVHHVLEEALDLIMHLASARGCSIHRPPPTASERYVMADQQRFKQVLLNLLSNAVKFNRENGSVTITCEERPGKNLRINVADTGLGISSEKMQDLFAPFARLGADRMRIEGTGVGLTLSKRLVEAMSGKIGAESVLNEGSTFWIELPLAEAPTAVLAPPKTEETTPAPQSLEVPKRQDGSRWSVLYIEDNPANLKLIKDLLALRPEIKLITALRGRLGLNLARRFVPDLVLLDLHLPDISGLEVLTELKAQPLTRKIPVVVLTADATPSQATTLKAAGCDDYLTKPLDMKRLLAVLGERLMRVQVSPRG